MLSYWEKESFVKYDYIIIGSGIVGLSTAISLKEKKPETSVLVLEKGLLPSGASTKNAGFACFGSLTELLEDLETIGAADTLELVHERWEGLQKLRERIGDKNFDFLNHGGYELIREQEMPFVEKIEEVNNLLKQVFPKPVFELKNDKINTFGFNRHRIKAMIFNQYEGQIHTGKMMASLLRIARSKDIAVITGAEVLKVEDSSGQVTVSAKNCTSNKYILYTAEKVAVCTNGFTNTLIEDLDLAPGRGIVLITKPIPNLPFQGVFHMKKGYYYFRNEGKRVLFGGGRNIDFDAETTTEFDTNKRIEKELHRQLKEVILPNIPFEIDQTWAGIMAFGKNKLPILSRHTENVHLGVRLGGMGVAIGSQMGEKLAQNLLNG